MFLTICRSILAGLAAVAATSFLLKPTIGYAAELSQPARELTELYERANAALLRGDVATWDKLAPMAKDFVLMSPFGGRPSRYADYTPERIERMARFFRNGRFQQEVVQAYSTDDMIVLVTIERANVEVGGLPAQDWGLRVTSVFTRHGSGWMLAHRHADPLVEDVSLEEAARLGRGERMLAAK
jgi:ketosteroid isomerase-like protein